MTLYIDGQPNSVLISPVKALVGGVSYNVTFPAASMTVAGINKVQSFSEIQTFNANVILGNGVGIATAAVDAATLILQARNTAAGTQTVLTVVGAATVAQSYITAQVGGTWTLASGQTWTLPALTMNGSLNLGNDLALTLGTGAAINLGNNTIIWLNSTTTGHIVTWKAYDVNLAGFVEVMRVENSNDPEFKLGSNGNALRSSNAGLLGFFATAPQAKPTGVAVTAEGIHAALVTLGLIAA